ncbi:glycosyltransferase [Vibrio campbellii]|uniref:Glycosyltransferase n=1 Tax=Vibrio campbellii TaxID=680 RepID=A0ABY5IGQ5_9VIBR|nr:glycosyltransferase [Vibrio campbellii]UTZ20577.1 glycosyltransferase [Vibrio campbellii]UTZ32069.1 glycosyltransferase [Vibrio campbellii]
MSRKIAVIMSVYKLDASEALECSIKSILEQSYNCDLFLYCDGLLPRELDLVIEQFLELDNVNVIKNRENKGLCYALNHMIDVTIKQGYDYIARMDSDDISLPERIEKQIGFMESNPDIDVLGGACREFGATFAIDYKCLPLTHDELEEFSIARCPFIHPTVIFRASIFQEGHRYPTNTSLTEDMALWYILLEAGKKFANLPDILIYYKMNENTVNRRRGLSKSLSEVKLRYKYMLVVDSVNVKNITSLLARFVFHLLPLSITRLLYKFAR